MSVHTDTFRVQVDVHDDWNPTEADEHVLVLDDQDADMSVYDTEIVKVERTAGEPRYFLVLRFADEGAAEQMALAPTQEEITFQGRLYTEAAMPVVLILNANDFRELD